MKWYRYKFILVDLYLVLNFWIGRQWKFTSICGQWPLGTSWSSKFWSSHWMLWWSSKWIYKDCLLLGLDWKDHRINICLNSFKIQRFYLISFIHPNSKFFYFFFWLFYYLHSFLIHKHFDSHIRIIHSILNYFMKLILMNLSKVMLFVTLLVHQLLYHSFIFILKLAHFHFVPKIHL